MNPAEIVDALLCEWCAGPAEACPCARWRAGLRPAPPRLSNRPGCPVGRMAELRRADAGRWAA